VIDAITVMVSQRQEVLLRCLAMLLLVPLLLLQLMLLLLRPHGYCLRATLVG